MKRSTRSSDRAEYELDVARLSNLSREELIQAWIKTNGHPPPRSIGRRLLELSAAYVLQAKVFGGLKPSLRKALAATLDPGSGPSCSNAQAAALRPGSRLVRVWNGRTHHVEVVEGGFHWNGEHFRSLSAIARKITGARWSGPRFFGL
jgi:hypothetical protein